MTPRQEGYLATWGYPYVLDDFRFHLTLTGQLAADEIAAVEAALQPLAGGFAEPFRLQEVALFVEPAPRAPFRLLQRFPLGG